MAATDVQFMPNVQRLLAKQGTTFDNAITSFPLCCPSRATFITGQYAHNNGVFGNFAPYGWYGMQGRDNTLPVWLDDVGYRTAMIGKWLNGYGSADAHGEIPRRVRHVARAARRLGLRLPQLRHEPGRPAAHVGRPRVRDGPREVRQGPGRRPARLGRVALRRAGGADGAAALDLLGRREPRGVLARRHGRDDREARQEGGKEAQALLHLVVGRRAAPRGRRDGADGQAGTRPAARRRATPTTSPGCSCRSRRASTSRTSATSPPRSRTRRCR